MPLSKEDKQSIHDSVVSCIQKTASILNDTESADKITKLTEALSSLADAHSKLRSAGVYPAPTPQKR